MSTPGAEHPRGAVVRVGQPHDVRIDRRTRWGNPFPMRSRTDAERARVIAAHRAWLWEEIRSERISLVDLAALDGQRLGCHCAQAPCHGDTLLRAAAWARRRLERRARPR